MLSSFSKYSRRRRPALGVFATLVAFSTAAHAGVIRETERFERKRVSAGEEVSRELACPRGTDLTGGGFALYNLPDNAAPFVVTASYPLDSAWRVEIRNITEGPQPLAFRIYALCSDS
jgi:hypothetical protein